MDELVSALPYDILAELISSGLIAAGKHAARLTAKRGESESRTTAQLITDATHSLSWRLATAGLLARIDGQSIKWFCSSPEVASTISIILSVGPPSPENEALRRQLVRRLTWFARTLCRLEDDDAHVLASELDSTLVSILERLAASTANSAPSRPSFSSGALGQLSLDHLSVDRYADLEKFITSLRPLLHSRSHLMPRPLLTSTKRSPILDAYVMPRIGNRPLESYQLPLRSEFERLDNAAPTGCRVVFLGSPGAGKSTAAQYLVHKSSCSADGREGVKRQMLVTIALRDLVAADMGIVPFIEALCRDRLSLSVPRGAVVECLAAGLLGAIFDGLDELGDPGRRLGIVQDVESFSANFPAASVIVTSRITGYQVAPLGPRFEVKYILPFQDDQVREFVATWFQQEDTDNWSGSGATCQTPTQLATNFLRESSTADELLSNPLLLTLLCGVYRGEGSLPKRLSEVYEKCALMLYERWDTSRGMSIPLDYANDMKPVICDLAHWIWLDERLQGGVADRALRDHVKEYLRTYRYPTSLLAGKAADEFVSYVTGRAWVFTDIGSTLNDATFAFTHRTFLEYFAACELTRRNITPAQLLDALLSMNADIGMDIVMPVALQLIERSVANGASRVVSLAANMALAERIQYPEASNSWYLAFSGLTSMPLTPSSVADVCRVAARDHYAAADLALEMVLDPFNMESIVESLIELAQGDGVAPSAVDCFFLPLLLISSWCFQKSRISQYAGQRLDALAQELRSRGDSAASFDRILRGLKRFSRGMSTHEEAALEVLELYLDWRRAAHLA